MAHNFTIEFKDICVDALRYGAGVSFNRYRFDCAKVKGNFDTQALKNLHRAILGYLKKKYYFLTEKYNNTDLVLRRESNINETCDLVLLVAGL